MSKANEKQDKSLGDRTHLIHSGRDPSKQHGFVNTPVYRGSTVLYPTVESLESRDREYTYGRRGT
ncbi:MAG: cystathionine beta-lyase, partial [Hyphomicrobiales bacterium]|nr:cystathionine beta-lyase [Hyphomicrobiales bacterium]